MILLKRGHAPFSTKSCNARWRWWRVHPSKYASMMDRIRAKGEWCFDSSSFYVIPGNEILWYSSTSSVAEIQGHRGFKYNVVYMGCKRRLRRRVRRSCNWSDLDTISSSSVQPNGDEIFLPILWFSWREGTRLSRLKFLWCQMAMMAITSLKICLYDRCYTFRDRVMVRFLIILRHLRGWNTLIFLHILSHRYSSTARFQVHRGRWRSKRRLRRRARRSWNRLDLDTISSSSIQPNSDEIFLLFVILLKRGHSPFRD